MVTGHGATANTLLASMGAFKHSVPPQLAEAGFQTRTVRQLSEFVPFFHLHTSVVQLRARYARSTLRLLSCIFSAPF